MLGLDGEKQLSWRKEDAKQKAAEFRQRALLHEIESNTVTVAPDEARDVSNLLAQLGKPLTSEDVQKRLKKCNSKLHFIRSPQFPELTGVYLILDEWEIGKDGEMKKKLKHLFGMESGIMPEFTVRHKTTKKVANPELFGNQKATREVDWKQIETFYAETRGWRTVLVRLLHLGLITRWHVEKYFGWNPSRESYNWHAHTQ